MRVIDIVTSDIRLFDANRFPTEQLRFDDVVDHIKTHFGFEAVYFQSDRHQSEQPVFFTLAEGRWNGHGIPEVSVQSRKVVSRVSGTTDDCAEVVGELQSFFSELSAYDNLTPITTTQESVITAELDIDFESMFDSRLTGAIDGFASGLTNSTEVAPTQITFRVQYQTPDKLQRHQIQLSPKPITILRKSDDPEDKAFYETRMPSDSSTHIGVLEKLEELF